MKIAQRVSRVVGALFAFMFVFLFFSCGGGESAFVGKWIPEKGSAPSGFWDNLELFKDGTGVGEEHSINWKVENNRFIVTSSVVGSAYNYEISDSVLILIGDNGKSAKYYNDVYLKKRAEKEAEKRAEAARKSKKEMTDGRDGKKYKTIKIGSQVWMAENLNYVPKAGNSWCYKNNESNCEKYGRLYDWKTALSVCPSGWHLPSDGEWDALATAVGGKETAGTKLKSVSGWYDNGNGTDEFGFSALPGSSRLNDGLFYGADLYGYWWSATEDDASDAYVRYLYYSYADLSGGSSRKKNGFSVRCLRD